MKAAKNSSTHAYAQIREPKEHEKELQLKIEAEFPNFSGRLLDIGCANGAFIELISRRFPEAQYTGIDSSPEMIRVAQSREIKGSCEFFVADALTFNQGIDYDIIIASGILSIYDDFQEPLSNWISRLTESGVLFVFGCFNSRNIDAIYRYRNNEYGDGEWESGLTSFSIETVGKFLQQLELSYVFDRFNLSIDLAEDPNPIRTYTRKTLDGETIIMNGANIVTELFFLSVIAGDTRLNTNRLKST